MTEYEAAYKKLRDALEGVEEIARTVDETRGKNATVERHLLRALRGACNEAAGRAEAVIEIIKDHP